MPRLRIIIVLALVLGGLSVANAAAGGWGSHSSGGQRLRPVVFIHGFSGSGAQFESQALRFTSNGYPSQLISVLDYDSLFGTETRDDVFARLDAAHRRPAARDAAPTRSTCSATRSGRR